MRIDKLNGLWKGKYLYGDSYPAEYQQRVEQFTMDIKFDGNNFTGNCSDFFSDIYFKQPALVEGTFVPNLISFIKRYPALLTVDENEQPIIIPEKPSVEIHYTGFFYKGLFSSTIRYNGEWTMTDYFLNELGEKEFYSCYGTWEMKK